MYYRRNTDERLRAIERQYQMAQNVSNLMLLNQERRRAGLPPIASATIQQVYEVLTNLTDVELKPPGESYGRFSFRHKTDRLNPEIIPCLEVEARVNVLPVRADNASIQWVQDQFQLMLPLIHNLGWIALYRQCGYGKVNLSIQKQIIEDLMSKEPDDHYTIAWAVVLEEDGETTLNEIHPGRDSAMEKLAELNRHMEDNRCYPSLAIFPQTVFRGTTSPLLASYLLNAYVGEPDDRQVLAAQWVIQHSYAEMIGIVLTQDAQGYCVGAFSGNSERGFAGQITIGPSSDINHIKIAFLNAILAEPTGPYPRTRCKFQLLE